MPLSFRRASHFAEGSRRVGLALTLTLTNPNANLNPNPDQVLAIPNGLVHGESGGGARAVATACSVLAGQIPAAIVLRRPDQIIALARCHRGSEELYSAFR